MKPEVLPFEPVSVDDARKALESAVVAPTPSRDPSLLRAPSDPASQVLSERAIRWLSELPADVRPLALPRDFGRIANRLADAWQDPDACLEYLDSLLFSDRPRKRGFPDQVGLEIAKLREHRMERAGLRQIGPQSDAWAEVECFQRLDRRGATKPA